MPRRWLLAFARRRPFDWAQDRLVAPSKQNWNQSQKHCVLQLTKRINKDTLAIKIQVSQVIREVGKVITNTKFKILADMAIQTYQCTAASILRIWQI